MMILLTYCFYADIEFMLALPRHDARAVCRRFYPPPGHARPRRMFAACAQRQPTSPPMPRLREGAFSVLMMLRGMFFIMGKHATPASMFVPKAPLPRA